jgi:histidinol-phosphate/aromatic aminotransferase/cobyric acid decarboxylase-like protein
MESLVPKYANLIICKSMSKCYSLSGLRVAYLASQKSDYLKKYIPPWSVSLPAQLAAIYALRNPSYYVENYRIIHKEREFLSDKLSSIGFIVYPGVANYILTSLPEETNFTSKTFIEACREKKLFLRDAQNMGITLTDKSVRFAIRSPKENKKVLKIVSQIIN